MFTFSRILIVICLLFSVSIAEVLIQEDFSDPTFPPEGWSVTTIGDGGSWSLTDSGQPGNGYAHGLVALPPFAGECSAFLKTNNFTLNVGDVLQLTFIRRNYWLQLEPPYRYWQVKIYKGNQNLYGILLGLAQNWKPVNYSHIINESSDEWHIEFEIYLANSGSNPVSTYFDLDDMIVENKCLDIDPTSLGCIKATFR